MSTTIAEPAPLTKLDIVAMRKADRLNFRHRNGNGIIHLHREGRKNERDPYGTSDGEYSFVVDSHVTAYDPLVENHWGKDVTNLAQCFESISSVSPDYSCWPAICALVREGDELRLKWVADGCNQYMRRSAQQSDPLIHFDTLEIYLRRKSKTLATFLMSYGHCPDNSARIIRGY